MTNDQMREAFEAWHKRASWYGDEPTAWEAWKAGIAVGMERAAGIAQNRAIYADTEGADELNAVAKDIRAQLLKEPA